MIIGNAFSACNSEVEIRKRYRVLAMQFHPDLGGCTETMQAINELYLEALRLCDREKTIGADNKERTYFYNADTEQAVIDKLSELLALKMSGVEIALVGSWIWIWGDTKPYKSALGKGGLGCRWSGDKQKWYWHSGKYRSKGKAKSWGHIAATYGVQSVSANDERKRITA